MDLLISLIPTDTKLMEELRKPEKAGEEIKELEDSARQGKLSAELKETTDMTFRSYNQLIWDNISSFAYEHFLTVRNSQKYTSFPREESIEADRNESARIKLALSQLRVYSKKIIEERSPEKPFTKEDLQGVVKVIQELMYYPKIPDDRLKKLDTPEDKKNWKEFLKKHHYNSNTEPRNNKLEVLYFVTAVHLETIFSCFVILNTKRIEITKKFVLEKAEEWKVDPSPFLEKVELLLGSEEEAKPKLEQEETAVATEGKDNKRKNASDRTDDSRKRHCI